MEVPTPEKPIKKTAVELMMELTGVDLERCPCCHKGWMKTILELRKLKQGFEVNKRKLILVDSS